MIDHVDANDASCLDHGASEVDVLTARLGIAGRVVMRKHDRGGMGCHGWSEDLPGLDRHMSDRTYSHNLERDQAQPDIEKQDGQRFLVSGPQRAKVRKRQTRCRDRLGLRSPRLIPARDFRTGKQSAPYWSSQPEGGQILVASLQKLR